jgi:hypothetical protein
MTQPKVRKLNTDARKKRVKAQARSTMSQFQGPQDVPVAIGLGYGKRESYPFQLRYPLADGKREIATFWLYAMDPAAQEAIRLAGGNPDAGMPGHSDMGDWDSEQRQVENSAFLDACLDREKGWENLRRADGEVIEYDPEEHEAAIHMLAGVGIYVSLMRAFSMHLAVTVELQAGDEAKNSGPGSGTDPAPGTRQS